MSFVHDEPDWEDLLRVVAETLATEVRKGPRASLEETCATLRAFLATLPRS